MADSDPQKPQEPEPNSASEAPATTPSQPGDASSKQPEPEATEAGQPDAAKSAAPPAVETPAAKDPESTPAAEPVSSSGDTEAKPDAEPEAPVKASEPAEPKTAAEPAPESIPSPAPAGPATPVAASESSGETAPDSEDSGEGTESSPAKTDEPTTSPDPGQPVPRSNSSGHGVTPRSSQSHTDDLDTGDEDPHHGHDEWHDDYDPHDSHHHDDPYHYEYDEEGHYHDHDHDDPYHGEVKPSASAVVPTRRSRETDLAVRAHAEPEEEEDEYDGTGGPVKSFLEHLEDLRWVIIKCFAALLIAMTLCLVAADKVVDLLKLPMDLAYSRAKILAYQEMKKAGTLPPPMIKLNLGGTNSLSFVMDESLYAKFPLKEGYEQPMKLVPTFDASTNLVLALRPDGEPVAFEPEVPIPTLQPLGVLDPFFAALKIAFFGGLGLASPFILFFIGQFVFPALHKHEQSFMAKGLAMGGLLFITGAMFAYLFISQITVLASVSFSQWMGFSTNIWKIDSYIGFVCTLMLGVGAGFELPVILLTLVKIGILDYKALQKFRPYWVVVNLAVSAFLTPPDVVSQVLMAIPLQLLYEISILVAWMWYRRDQREEAKELATKA